MPDKVTHWKQLMNLDYLGAWALQPGEEPILTIVSVATEKVVGADGKKEDCIVMRYKGIGPGKMVLNSTNCKTIEAITGTPHIEKWAGAQIQVYSEKVKAFGAVVDALRVRPYKPRAKDPVPNCSECGSKLKEAYGMKPASLAEYTKEKYNAVLCAACAEKRAAAGSEGEGSAE